MDAPRLSTSVYWNADTTTADIYLTDLAGTDLDPSTPLAELLGRIVHLHLFVVPLAGNTPIENSACSVTIRHIVMASGQVGVYSGGGFLNPTRVSDSEFGGTIRGATLRLTSRTPGFADKLGPATMELSYMANREVSLAKRIGSRVNEILLVTKEEKTTK